MASEVLTFFKHTVQVLAFVILAGLYVFLYHDYMQTITQNDLVSMSAGEPEYRNGGLGVIVIREEVTVQPARR